MTKQLRDISGFSPRPDVRGWSSSSVAVVFEARAPNHRLPVRTAEPPQVLEAKRQMQRETQFAGSDQIARISEFAEDQSLVVDLVWNCPAIPG